MIKIETKVLKDDDVTTDILMEYEVDNALTGEYLSILDKVKKEVLENTNIDEETLKEILFGKKEGK
jgi:undecaprenyl pyrophosphate synthase